MKLCLWKTSRSIFRSLARNEVLSAVVEVLSGRADAKKRDVRVLRWRRRKVACAVGRQHQIQPVPPHRVGG